jgi:hypothetical protein
MNLRELVHLISTTLHAPGVERHAARLMRAISNEMKQILQTRTLDDTQNYAIALTRDPDLSRKVGRIRGGKSWNDLGDLKRDLLDMWAVERNALAKRVMQDLEGQQ